MKIDKNIINLGIQMLTSLFAKKVAPPAPVQAAPKPIVLKEPVKALPKAPEQHEIDWSNPKANITKYFTVQEAIVLREWGRLANESDGLNDTVKKNLIAIFTIMDEIRELLGKPVYVRSAYRPAAYNVAIGGAKRSAHLMDADYGAVDFWTDQDGDGDKDGKDCDDIKAILMPLLEQKGLRMEDNGKGARWIHIDNRKPGPGGRFFKP